MLTTMLKYICFLYSLADKTMGSCFFLYLDEVTFYKNNGTNILVPLMCNIKFTGFGFLLLRVVQGFANSVLQCLPGSSGLTQSHNDEDHVEEPGKSIAT